MFIHNSCTVCTGQVLRCVGVERVQDIDIALWYQCLVVLCLVVLCVYTLMVRMLPMSLQNYV